MSIYIYTYIPTQYRTASIGRGLGPNCLRLGYVILDQLISTMIPWSYAQVQIQTPLQTTMYVLQLSINAMNVFYINSIRDIAYMHHMHTVVTK